jgi:hypothetical protein
VKLAEKIERLRRAAPHVSNHGQLYKNVRDTKRRYKRVTLYTLFFSEERTHLLRNHVFDSKSPRSPTQWAEWFAANLTEIHHNAVLPGLAIRTGKSWAVQRILGWVGDVEHKANRAKMGRTRHKTKHKRRKNG